MTDPLDAKVDAKHAQVTHRDNREPGDPRINHPHSCCSAVRDDQGDGLTPA